MRPTLEAWAITTGKGKATQMPNSNEHIAVAGFRLGRRTPTPKVTLALGRYLTGAPAYPPSVDHLTGVARWNMGANNRYGTCGPTSIANYMTMMFWNLHNELVSVADDDVFTLYRQAGNPNFNPATDADDNGVDMVQLMQAFLANGIWVTRADGSRELHKPLAFGSLTTHDMDQVKLATAIFGGVIFGLSLDVAQQSQAIWDNIPGSSPWGGHAVLGGKYTGSPGASGDEVVITWAQPKATTDVFIIKQDEEAYIPIMPDIVATSAFQRGVNQDQLAADFTALTGQPWPEVAPTPGPSPAPVPPAPAPTGPAAEDATMAAAIRTFNSHVHTTQANRDMGKAGAAWLDARGL